MNLKRNIFTILYATVFLLIMGTALFQILNLTFVISSSKYMVAGIVVLGIIIYLILAFLIKENGRINNFEKKRAFFTILECIVIISCVGILFVLRYVDNVQIAVLHSALLLFLGLVGRLLFGRLNGIITTIVGFIVLLFMENILILNTNNTLFLLCILVPYAAFLGINRFIIGTIGKNDFVIMSYLVLGFLFAISTAINPFVLFLFAGCVLSLLFGKPDVEHSMLTKGISCAGLLVLFTGCLFAIAYFLIPGLITIPDIHFDSTIPLSSLDLGLVSFFVNKFAKPVNYLMLAFNNGIIPTILLFFAILPGYYCITKKASYIGPMLFSFLGLVAYYMLFCEVGSDFFYFTYLLPIFVGYGLTNTLISDSSIENGEIKETQTQDVSEEDNVSGITVDESQAVPPVATETVAVEEPGPIKESEPTIELEPAETHSSTMSDTVKNFISSQKNTDEIPEWTIPSEFIEQTNDVEENSVQESVPEPATLEPVAEDSEIVENTKEELLSDEIIEENDPIEPSNTQEFTLDAEDDSVLTLDDLVTEDQTEPSLIEGSADVLEYDTDITELTHDGTNDFEQFISNENAANDDILGNANDNDIELEPTEPTDEALPLDELLDRLDISDNIKRMNEEAQEDIADVIERDEEQVELDEALPLKPSKSTLPKYKKPNFDFELEPVSIPLDESYSNISEYDEVPTVHDLESKWKSKDNTVIETVASPVVEEPENKNESTTMYQNDPALTDVHSDEIVKKSGLGKRSYHRIIIR